MLIAKIISDEQPGVGRGAIEAALELGFPYGGLIPKGRLAEDGLVPLKFSSMTEDTRKHGLHWAELQDMCWQKGHNWNNLETVEKRGFCVCRREVVVEGRQGPVTRMKFLIDRDIPIFTSSDSAEWWSRFLKA